MANEIMKLVPTIMSVGLLSHNANYLNKNIKQMNSKKKYKPDFGGLLGLGVTNIVGTSLIKETSDFVNF